ncbi:MAG: flagellar motor protein MotB [Deltaproteobacteria bacterium]|nr:flagellar motor protein MotB [Deltaproteobacteria bacterium]MBW1930551.1 flagellar motor protein MotB [Deltaproteobacteria bacterium]MBW2026152.1 flagellar motor protein MotB [Deltaproteobacteria bacterium]MBW2126282.1 flagellar motor protein MotB [Deltaproteobacteria bacterium]RLB23778.1 MAG: hypothetical protein DRG76_03275 [Deltaproteobacteria bacterium]
MARKKAASDGGGGSTSSWMVTFSDLATLLLTFFVLLLSMSSLDDLKLKSMFQNFTSSSGILLFKKYGEIYHAKEILIQGLYEKLKDALIVNKETQGIEKELASNITENPFTQASGAVRFENIENGFKLVFGQELLFYSGRAEIKEEMKPVLRQVAEFIRVSNYQVYIDGHTDAVPIHNERYASNEELSLARAYNIMEYLIKECGVPARTIALSGYGAQRPVASNKTAQGRAKNRRVEIIFKNQKYF